MVQRPRPDLRGGCAAMRIPTVTITAGRKSFWKRARSGENGGDKLVHGSGGISQPRAE